MPIETERPGIFLGREWNTTSWYAVDPAAPGGSELARSEWLRQTRSTNSSRWRRAAGLLVGACVLAVGTWGLVAAMIAVNVAIIGVFAAIAFVILVALSIAAGASVGAGTSGTGAVTEHVREVSSDVAIAVDDDIDLADLWELNDHYSRMNELLSAFSLLEDVNDEDRPRDAEWALEHVVRPALESELARRTELLEEIARRVGVVLPDAAKPRPSAAPAARSPE